MPRIRTNLSPSADEATLSTLKISRGVQFSPESVEVWIVAPIGAAMSLLPSAEDATEFQILLVSRAVHVAPESVEV